MHGQQKSSLEKEMVQQKQKTIENILNSEESSNSLSVLYGTLIREGLSKFFCLFYIKAGDFFYRIESMIHVH